MSDRLFLYLQREEYAQTWAHGGTVPISRASDYRRVERTGVFTPDEVIQRELYGFAPGADRVISKHFTGSVWITDGEFDLPEFRGHVGFGHQDYKLRDSHILCFSRTLSLDLMKRFGNKRCVVELNDPLILFDSVSDQLGEGQFDHIVYTDATDRDDFLKGESDSWQCEVRMTWPVNGEIAPEGRKISIPEGTARLIHLGIEAEFHTAPLIAKQTLNGADRQFGVRQAIEGGFYSNIDPRPLQYVLRARPKDS